MNQQIEMSTPKSIPLGGMVEILGYEQKIKSDETTRKQKSAGARLLTEMFGIDCGFRVLDFGGGKFSESQEYINSIGGHCYVYDPYNRTLEENMDALSRKYTYMMCNNVLNVLTDDVLPKVINDMWKIARSCGVEKILITVYERDKSGVGCETGRNSYQRNERTAAYMKYLTQFGSVEKKSKALIVSV